MDMLKRVTFHQSGGDERKAADVGDDSSSSSVGKTDLSRVRSVRLTLVRHGQTEHNKNRIIQGQNDSYLTDLGKEEARLLGRYFKRKKVKFEWVFTSDLRRCVDTCCLICDELRPDDVYKGTPTYQSSLLRERSYGIYEGLTGREMRQKAFEAGLNPEDVATFRPEGGETLAELAARAKEFFDQLFPKLKHLDRVLIVTHGGVIREMMRLFIQNGCPLSNRDTAVTPNTALNNFDVHLFPDNTINNPSGEDTGDDEEIDVTRAIGY